VIDEAERPSLRREHIGVAALHHCHAALVKWAFEAHATGTYSTITLASGLARS
jgi:hypothetical protein